VRANQKEDLVKQQLQGFIMTKKKIHVKNSLMEAVKAMEIIMKLRMNVSRLVLIQVYHIIE